MRYIGSKTKLLPLIKKIIIDRVGTLEDKKVCDLFAGTGVVSCMFKEMNALVVSNDLEFRSKVFCNYYLNNLVIPERVPKIIKTLNQYTFDETLSNGFITDFYSPHGVDNRTYFTTHDAKKIDACRWLIDIWKKENIITETEHNACLVSILEAVDKIANTSGTYGAYNKKFDKKKSIRFTPLNVPRGKHIGKAFSIEAENLDLIPELQQGDVLYMDPPYNGRQYSSYYHLPTTIAKWELDFIPQAVAGYPPMSKRKISSFSSKTKALATLDTILRKADYQHIFMSYSSDSVMATNRIKTTEYCEDIQFKNIVKDCPEDILNLMGQYGIVELEKIDFRRYKADKKENREHDDTPLFEYVFYLRRNVWI